MRGIVPVGKEYGRLTVLSKTENTGKISKWTCRCSCGTIKDYNTSNLKRGLSKSCGCLQRELQSRRQLVDRTGDSYGRLTVIGQVGYRRDNALWSCNCICGNVVQVTGGALATGETRSCGCLQRERASEAKSTHGKSDSKEYRSWLAMRTRCSNEKRDNFKYYGGRGITVCDRWLSSFENFFEDMGPAPSKDHTVERNDGDKNYEPGNCRWATPKEQARNTSSSRFVEWDGVKMTVAELAETLGKDYDLILSRLSRGWPLQDAVNRPKGFRIRHKDTLGDVP